MIIDKWMATIEVDIKNEIERISQRLSQRIKELAERYEMPQPRMVKNVTALEKKVNIHLQRMGYKW